MICKKCQSNDFEDDPTRGVKVCMQCGQIAQNISLQSEQGFQNNKATGHFLNMAKGPISPFMIGRGQLGGDQRGLRLHKANKVVEQIASQLQLSKQIIESAQTYYKQAYEKNFIQGRNTRDVAGVCLYIACRTLKTAHLLIDFSDVLKVNVYKLGSIYLGLKKALYFVNNSVPDIDPSLYIQRYCHRLEFENKKIQVGNTALRLLQSMKRAWITTGRRPNGLCGAAILIAARYHGFKRNISQIVKVVHVCQETIRKRLDEFKDTKTAQITREELKEIEETHAIDSDIVPVKMQESMDPPSFTKANCQRILELESGIEEVHKMIQEKASMFDQQLEQIESEQIEMKRESSRSQQLVPYMSGEQNNYQLVTSIKEEDDESIFVPSSSNQLVLKMERVDWDVKGTLSCSDIDDEEIEEMILNDDEKRLKKHIWDSLNKDWLKQQKQKKREKKALAKIKKETKKATKEKEKVQIESNRMNPLLNVEADNPALSMINSGKFSTVNPQGLIGMFTKQEK